MKIMLVHNSYQQAGGEDIVFEQEKKMLEKYGHIVSVFYVSNNIIKDTISKFKVGINIPYNGKMKDIFKNELSISGADIVHIHNFFPLLTPAIHQAACELGLAVVQTLHNYRLLCANATFLRDGEICEKCLHSSRAWAVVHRCYRNSFAGSLAVVAMQRRAEHQRTWHRNVHRFIALTEFARRKFVEGGLPEDRITVKPNFLPGNNRSFSKSSSRRGALYVGRISKEKGVANLISAWNRLPNNMMLTVVGDGPERAELQRMAPRNVVFKGQQSQFEVHQAMREASVLVVPSIWYEGFPMTIIEALAEGLPIFASDIGSLTEIVKNGKNGVKFRPNDPIGLGKAILEFMTSFDSQAIMQQGARQDFEQNYTEDRNIKIIESIYREAIQVKEAMNNMDRYRLET